MRASFLSPQQSCPAGDAPLQHTEADDRRIIALRHCSDKKKHSSFRISNIWSVVSKLIKVILHCAIQRVNAFCFFYSLDCHKLHHCLKFSRLPSEGLSGTGINPKSYYQCQTNCSKILSAFLGSLEKDNIFLVRVFIGWRRKGRCRQLGTALSV